MTVRARSIAIVAALAVLAPRPAAAQPKAPPVTAPKLTRAPDVEERKEAAKEGDDDDLEIVITVPPTRKQVVSTEVSADQGRRVAGAQGDGLRVVENLPGVARSTVGSGALVVWGASPEDTRVYVDGVRVPRLYHDGALRSVVHSELVKSVELAPGGYGALYGRGLGGLVTVALDPLEEKGFHRSIAADVLDAAGSVRASWDACPTGSTPASCAGSEQYVWFDPEARVVSLRREAIRVAWFTTAGALATDSSGVAEDDAAGSDTDNTWTAPDTAGEARLWLVVRDDRGGVGWQSYRVRVE